MEKEDTFTLELDRKLLDYALRCGFDLTCDGEKAVRYGILANMVGISFETRGDAAQVARDLLGDDWPRWLTIIDRDVYGAEWYELRVTATAWEYLHDRYMTRHAQAQYMRDLSASFDLTEADND
ncbi:hypothetical protein NUU00_10055 (plasmid) [Bifidobacterium breve]|jgi:hypothetical protein|uniref:Uncharacterized protein n=3 Tax=Bacillati TaxID=1783272 RepID=A0A9E1GMU4_9FIRM|nr:hypothetical protein [Bifidobacterium breve]MBS6623271.1 hypothetical protein [Faecalibacterium prausnitzii]UUY18116.1 hypothetical protein NUU00_10055 [Bifidobacterium breve]